MVLSLAFLGLFLLPACSRDLTREESSPTTPRTDPCGSLLQTPRLQVLGRHSLNGVDNYKLSVANWRDFPESLFVPSPQLPPCGLNAQASRTWVEIFVVPGHTRVYGYCSLDAPSALVNTMYAPIPSRSPVTGVFIEMTDRLCGSSVRSNVAPVNE